MKKRHKLYLKLNLISLFFIVASFIFTTLAWFAYSGLSKLETEIDVKAWYIELSKSGETVSNNVVISLPTIYPGMDTVSEVIDIQNFGDSDAELSYKIISARILNDEFVTSEELDSDTLEDTLSHEYPFHVNIGLSNKVVLAETGTGSFEVSVSWPLDSGNDSLDSEWGKNAYQFDKNEKFQKQFNSKYVIRPSIQIVINVTAEQYVESEKSSSRDYVFGKKILFDPVNNKFCTELSTICMSTTVIDANNKLNSETITLLPNIYSTYESSTYDEYQNTFNRVTNGWTVEHRSLTVSDLLKVISTDVKNSYLVAPTLSNSIIGNMKNSNRITEITNKAISYNGYFTFLNDKFKYLYTSNSCYWLGDNYNDNQAFALTKIDTITSKIYGEDKSSICEVMPVIIAKKSDVIVTNETNDL